MVDMSYVQIAKEKKWGKKCLEICAIKGGGGSTPNGKNHLKFPFWLSDNLPNVDPNTIVNWCELQDTNIKIVIQQSGWCKPKTSWC